MIFVLSGLLLALGLELDLSWAEQLLITIGVWLILLALNLTRREKKTL